VRAGDSVIMTNPGGGRAGGQPSIGPFGARDASVKLLLRAE